MRRAGTQLVLALATALGTVKATAQGGTQSAALAAPAMRRDSVALLLQRIAAGEVALTGTDIEILRTVLNELRVPVESQMTVFSRTSMQAGLIRPTNPRVLYFSESTYVGWVPGGLVEVVAIDPEKGANFYVLDPQDARDKRRSFVRETSCFRCHGSGAMEPSPTLFARSIISTDRGEPLRERGSEFVTEQMPFERRWGGWYVTGYAGPLSHRGNAFGREQDGRLDFNPSEQRPAELSAFFDTSRYLAGTSDVVALLVFEHQLAVQNSLLRAGQNARRLLNAPSSDKGSEFESALGKDADDVLDHLLFRGAAPLPAGVLGSAAFARAFAADAPRSGRGHALKDLSLRDRLFANRCSFLIHSELFATLPSPLKDRVLDRLAAALNDERPDGRYAYLEKGERQRIREVLEDTLPETHLHFEQQRSN